VGGTLDLRRLIKRCAECDQKFSHDAMFCPFDGTNLVEVPWDPSADPLLGKRIDGRYDVVGVLGEGGMGTVYKVEHTSLQRAFAMKVLRRDLAREHDLAARFTQEARATASIKHPNIVAITDFGRLPDDIPYFVMEMLVGQTMSQAIKGGGPIPAARGIKIVLKIASALGAAHQARVVHRDLKPENVFLVGRDASSDDVRIVDFGAAMILGASRVTKTGIVFGTPHYMSPEQASGQPVDHRADIYALGVIMYEMFTGKVPFEADTYMGVLTQHMFVQPVPPSEIAPSAKNLGALEDVTLRALEKKPEHRYATMEELAAEIQRAVQFTPDGGVKIAASKGERLPASRPVYDLANQLELPTSAEIEASLAPASLRGDKIRRAALYGAIAFGLGATALGTTQILRARRMPDASGTAVLTNAAPPPATSSAASRSAPPLPDIPPPPAAPAPEAPSASAAATSSDAGAPPATAAYLARSGERAGASAKPAPKASAAASAAASASASPPPTPTISEFTDPWAK
jgi:serine/threonine-protein kinase